MVKDKQAKPIDLATAIPPQVYWRCRRGMLELDLIFERFLQRGYACLTQKEQACFLALLQEPEAYLWDWLILGRPATKAYVALVAFIRECAVLTH